MSTGIIRLKVNIFFFLNCSVVIIELRIAIAFSPDKSYKNSEDYVCINDHTCVLTRTI